MNFKEYIREVSGFPTPAVNFYDITTLLKDRTAFNAVINRIAEKYLDKRIDIVLGIEARGFIIGAPVAHKLGVGFVPARKPGKLPAETARREYDLEYGKDALEVHKDAIQQGQRVLIIDDVLVTGGTARAAADLVESLGGEVISMAFLIELSKLNGRKKLAKWNVECLITY